MHIDSPLEGLEAKEGAPAERIRSATRMAFSNIVSLCLREKVSFLVIAGDVFDGDWKDFSTGLFFLRELNRLRDSGCRVYMIRGNHDSASEVTKHLGKLPPHAHELSSRAPETLLLDDLGVAIHGYSFPQRAVTEDLVPRYPDPRRGLFNLGILHTSADGSPEHDSYAPCTVRDLSAKGYQYWALGHIHKRRILDEDPAWIVFPGNPQGRHAKETGARGVSLVTVENGEVSSVEHVPTDVVRFESISIELTEQDGLDELYEVAARDLRKALETAAGRLLAVRLRISGRCAAHRAAIERPQEIVANLRARAQEIDDDLWLEKVILDTTPVLSLERLRQGKGLVASVLQGLAAMRANPEAARAFVGETLSALRKTGAAEVEALRLTDSADDLLRQVELLLAASLEEGAT